MRVLRFTAKWCQPCKALAQSLATIPGSEKIEVFDIDESDLYKEYEVRSVPTIIVLDDTGNEKFRCTGTRLTSGVEEAISRLGS